MARSIGTANGDILQGGPDADFMLALAGDDELQGDDGSDLLDGGLGRDQVFGGEGDDQLVGGTFEPLTAGEDDDLLDGGNGSDWVIYLNQSANVDLAVGSAETNRAVDQLVGIENIAASGILTGDAGDNILLGLGWQFDTFKGGAGDDLMIGSDAVHPGGFPNFDTVDYSVDPAEVEVDLAAGTARDGSGCHDTITGIEAVNGSPFDDVILGNAAANFLSGGEGNDRLEGREQADLLAGDFGQDVIDGGEGSDWVVSRGSETIDLGAGTATDEFLGEVDTLIGIENVLSFGGGTLIGDAGANRFALQDSNSVVTGGEGADRVLQLTPGNGVTIETLTDFEPGVDLLQFQSDVLSFDQPLPEGPLDPALFAIGTAAEEDDLFVFDPVTGTLSIDRDGSGEREAIPTMILQGTTELAASDIEIIPADFLGSLVLGSQEPLIGADEEPLPPAEAGPLVSSAGDLAVPQDEEPSPPSAEDFVPEDSAVFPTDFSGALVPAGEDLLG